MLLTACGSSGSDAPGKPSSACTPGESRSCLGLGCPALQICSADGQGWGECTCDWGDGGLGGFGGGTGSEAGVDGSAGMTFDMSADFPGVANPNGPWTYGWAPTLGLPLLSYPTLVTTADGPNWHDPANNNLGTPSVWKNTTDSLPYGVPPGFVALHPGQAGEYSVVRFTAPVAGSYAASIQFLSGDSGETEGVVRVDGVTVFSQVTTANPTHVVQPTPLPVGATIEAWVGPFGDGGSDNTPVVLVITAL
ncbi:MAG: hypothetical protein KF718_00390 [Polyangiaceae bacterium]|nr:hypothetical protein [Polyangiaceae bacterium]